MSGPYTQVEYRTAGEIDKITNTNSVQISTVGVGTHLKITFEAPFKTNQNPYGQVGLRLLKVYGEPDGYHNYSSAPMQSLISLKDRVDSTRLELGVPLRHLAQS